MRGVIGVIHDVGCLVDGLSVIVDYIVRLVFISLWKVGPFAPKRRQERKSGVNFISSQRYNQLREGRQVGDRYITP